MTQDTTQFDRDESDVRSSQAYRDEVLQAVHDAIEAGDVRINGYPDYRQIVDHMPQQEASHSGVQKAVYDLETIGAVAVHMSLCLDEALNRQVATVEPLEGTDA